MRVFLILVGFFIVTSSASSKTLDDLLNTDFPPSFDDDLRQAVKSLGAKHNEERNKAQAVLNHWLTGSQKDAVFFWLAEKRRENSVVLRDPSGKSDAEILQRVDLVLKANSKFILEGTVKKERSFIWQLGSRLFLFVRQNPLNNHYKYETEPKQERLIFSLGRSQIQVTYERNRFDFDVQFKLDPLDLEPSSDKESLSYFLVEVLKMPDLHGSPRSVHKTPVDREDAEGTFYRLREREGNAVNCFHRYESHFVEAIDHQGNPKFNVEYKDLSWSCYFKLNNESIPENHDWFPR